MTVSSSTSRIEYTGNAVTTAFSFPYYFLANGDLKVYLNGVLQTITTHYTVAGAGVGAGGTVTFVTAPPNAQLVVIYREVALTQSVDYTPNDPFPANTHEQALDRLTMITQQLDEESGRALALPSTSTYENLTLPDPQAGFYLQWKTNLSGLQNASALDAGSIAVSGFMETLLDDANAAAARATLLTASASETLTNKTLTDPILDGQLSGTAFLDEDAMTSNSAIATCSQRSIRAYTVSRTPFIAITTINSGTPVAEISIASGTSFSTYREVEIVVTVKPNTNGDSIYCQLGDAGGWLATNYEHITGQAWTVTTGATFLPLSGAATGTSSEVVGTLKVFQPNGAAQWLVQWDGAYIDSSLGELRQYKMSGRRQTTAPTRIRFYASTGNILGSIRLYGRL